MYKRQDGTLSYLRPDGKTQVTVEYDDGKPSRLDAVVLSTQHDPDITQEQIHEDIKREVFDKILPADMVDDETKFFINPTGRFVIGGPHGDAGLTGRKIIVDTYCLLYTSKKSMKTNKTKPIPEDVFDKILYHAVHDEKDVLTKSGIICLLYTSLINNLVCNLRFKVSSTQ